MIRPSERIEIQISQKHREVLEELKIFLFEMNIKSHVCKSREIFKLTIGDRISLKRFFEEIGSNHNNHKRKVEKALAILGRKLDSTPGIGDEPKEPSLSNGYLTRKDGRMMVSLKGLPDTPRGAAWPSSVRGVSCLVKSRKSIGSKSENNLI